MAVSFQLLVRVPGQKLEPVLLALDEQFGAEVVGLEIMREVPFNKNRPPSRGEPPRKKALSKKGSVERMGMRLARLAKMVELLSGKSFSKEYARDSWNSTGGNGPGFAAWWNSQLKHQKIKKSGGEFVMVSGKKE